VYIDEAAMANLCFGLIGSGERFCLAKKLGPYTHCGLPAHAKGIRKKNKAKVVADAYYVPGGTIHQRPTAKVDPMIARVDLPAKYIPTFRTARLTTAKWKDLIIDARTDIGDSEEDEDNSKIMRKLKTTKWRRIMIPSRRDLRKAISWLSKLSKLHGIAASARSEERLIGSLPRRPTARPSTSSVPY
jgi:hypothetical protein